MALESTPGPEGGPDGQVLAVSGPHVVLGGHGWVSIIRFSLGIKFYQTLWVLESSQGPEGAPDGKVLAISGPLVVLGGQGWFPIIRFLYGINAY